MSYASYVRTVILWMNGHCHMFRIFRGSLQIPPSFLSLWICGEIGYLYLSSVFGYVDKGLQLHGFLDIVIGAAECIQEQSNAQLMPLSAKHTKAVGTSSESLPSPCSLL